MTRFAPGQAYSVRKWSDFGRSTFGVCTITHLEEKPENEIEWRETSIRGSFDAEIGTITFVLDTASNNDKPKKASLRGARVSEAWAKEHGTDREYQWFSPTGRSYTPITAGKDFAEADR